MRTFTIILLSVTFSWELNLYIQDVDDVAGAANDYLVLGTCNECHDGFHYGEDQYDPPTGVSPYTDIQFFNLDWLGTIDSNNNECENPEFAVDKKSTHPPSDLLEWGIRGVTMGHNASLEITWQMDDISEDYEIYIYIGENGYNMRNQASININSGDLAPVYENINGQWVSYDNIKILMGGCASTGTSLYYIDSDEDGLGSGAPYEFCPGYEPQGYIDNNLDLDDNLFCISNVIDDCGICDGNNVDQDCNGTCFGIAELDDCGICDGNNEQCIDQIFTSLPYNLHALINQDEILISWDFDLELNQSFINGFNIYHGFDELNLTLINSTQSNSYQTNDFEYGIFCVSLFDRFNNESELVCTNASEYMQYSYILHEGANLISFPYIPENNSVENIFDSIKDELEGIIGEGSAAYYDPNLGWIGNLDNIDYFSGYWLKIKPNSDIENIGVNILGFPNSEIIAYNLHEGYNLISYTGQDNIPIEEAIPEELQDYIISIIGEGRASIYNHDTNQWLGNLTELNFGSGYWLEITVPISFYWQD